MGSKTLGIILPITMGCGLAGLCFFVAFNKRARRFMVNFSVWRRGNDEQKRLMETLTAVFAVIAGIAILVFVVVGVLVD